MSFIEIKNLTIDSSMDGINFTAVNNISLSIKKGSKVAILGESGAGKSLITKLLAGVIDTEQNTVSSGEILIDGVNILAVVVLLIIIYLNRIITTPAIALTDTTAYKPKPISNAPTVKPTIKIR